VKNIKRLALPLLAATALYVPLSQAAALPIARTHNLYHYQILVKYRFEEELESALNQVLELTQLRDNKNLRILIDSEPQNFV